MTTSRLGSLAEICTTVLGLILAAAPLALWVAPTMRVFLTVLAVTILAAAGLCLLDLIHGEKKLLSRLLRSRPVRGLPEKFIVELLKLLPLTHHNRRPGDPEFQRKMDALKKLLDK